MAVGLSLGTSAPAWAQSAPCHSLDIQIRIDPTEEPECLSGNSDDGDFKGGWEYIQMRAGERFIAAALERAGIHSVFYRPRLETAVESLVGDEADRFEWGASVEDERFDARRFEVEFDKGLSLPCVGFLATGGHSMGSEVKSAAYGYLCSLNGSAFADAEVTDMLSRIHF